MIEYVDTHVHFDGTGPREQVASVIARAGCAGVTRMLAVGGDAARNAFAVACAREHPEHVRAAIGYDRDCAAQAGGSEEALESLLGGSVPIAAIGEIGLDLHYALDTRREQRELLARMLAVARGHALPVIVHSREAVADTVDLLREHARARGTPAARVGVLHCFTGDGTFARQLIELGFYIGFSGIVTFKNAEALRAVSRQVPDDRLLIETDAPYLAPVPHRGQPNEPAYVPRVAERLAAVRGTRVETIAAVTFENACRLFNWPR